MTIPLTNEQRAYLAGIVDGEGWIGVEASPRSKVDRKMRYRIAVNINNTHEELIRTLRGLLNMGTVYSHDPPPGKNWKKIWVWVVKGGAARYLLEQVQEFLIVKREQAKLALDGPDTEEKWLAIKAVNKRGVGEEHGVD